MTRRTVRKCAVERKRGVGSKGTQNVNKRAILSRRKRSRFAMRRNTKSYRRVVRKGGTGGSDEGDYTTLRHEIVSGDLFTRLGKANVEGKLYFYYPSFVPRMAVCSGLLVFVPEKTSGTEHTRGPCYSTIIDGRLTNRYVVPSIIVKYGSTPLTISSLHNNPVNLKSSNDEITNSNEVHGMIEECSRTLAKTNHKFVVAILICL